MKKKSNPFGDAKPVDVKFPVEKNETANATAPDVIVEKKKVDPFGGAKPVDTASKTVGATDDDDEPNPFAGLKKKKKKKKKKAYVPDLS